MKTALQYAQDACEMHMNRFAPNQLGALPGYWTYHQGVFLSGVNRVYEKCKKASYMEYIKNWVECTLDENGKITEDGWWISLECLDFRQPGLLLLPLYKYTGNKEYLDILEYLTESLLEYPVNSAGGFWHSLCDGNGKNEMWLDGLYMAGPLCTSYGAFMKKPEFIDLGVKQIELMWENMRPEGSDLLRHGWDDTKSAPWADKETGLSQSVWARAMGWFTVAICDMLDDIPSEHPRRKNVEDILRNALYAVIDCQDKKDGRWYEVLDMPGREGNWLENSASCMFVYAIAKAVQKGILEPQYMDNAKKGYDGIIKSLSYSEDGELLIGDICIGTCIDEGTYEHYINRKKCVNDLHGSGAFVLMCSQVDF